MKVGCSAWRMVVLALLGACRGPTVAPSQDVLENEPNEEDEGVSFDSSSEEVVTADGGIMDAAPGDLARSDLSSADHPIFDLDLVEERDGVQFHLRGAVGREAAA